MNWEMLQFLQTFLTACGAVVVMAALAFLFVLLTIKPPTHEDHPHPPSG